MNRLLNIIIVFVFLITFQAFTENTSKPTVYIIGDSTVKNGQGDGAGGLWGWGRLQGVEAPCQGFCSPTRQWASAHCISLHRGYPNYKLCTFAFFRIYC